MHFASLFFVLGISVLVSACGGGTSDTKPIATNQPPIFTSESSVNVAENTLQSIYQAKAEDMDNDALTYSIVGGEDKNLFSIQAKTGQLGFKNPPNYESPADLDGNNLYELRLQVSDGKASVTQVISVYVEDENDTLSNPDVVIKMKDASDDSVLFVYEPNFIKVQPGQKIGFEKTSVGHNAVSELTPNGASGWQVGYSGGEVILQQEGVYVYYCEPHKSFGMYGIIQVGDANVNKDAAITFANDKATQIQMFSAGNARKLREAIAKIE